MHIKISFCHLLETVHSPRSGFSSEKYQKRKLDYEGKKAMLPALFKWSRNKLNDKYLLVCACVQKNQDQEPCKFVN